jgi:hypothetical protein
MLSRVELLAITALSLIGTGETAGKEPQPLPAQSKPEQNVVVPIPREIFDSLDQFANSNWRTVQRPEVGSWKPHGDQTRIALQLGVVIAEGFIAVEVQDADQVKDLGRTVLTLARALGVEKVVLRRSRSIVDYASRNDWVATRNEWDAVRADVSDGMIELKSERLAQLVSLGGWLRGAEVLSALLLQSYSPDRAELLRQPGLLDHFEKQLDAMSKESASDPIIARLQQGVRQVRRLTGEKGDPIAKETVGKINGISSKLIVAITAEPDFNAQEMLRTSQAMGSLRTRTPSM